MGPLKLLPCYYSINEKQRETHVFEGLSYKHGQKISQVNKKITHEFEKAKEIKPDMKTNQVHSMKPADKTPKIQPPLTQTGLDSTRTGQETSDIIRKKH